MMAVIPSAVEESIDERHPEAKPKDLSLEYAAPRHCEARRAVAILLRHWIFGVR